MIIVNIPLDSIQPNPYQTRFVEPESVKELADDIRANGLMQIPLGRLVKDGKLLPYMQLANTEENVDRIYQELDYGAVIQLAFGHRRFSAFRLLAADPNNTNFDTMPVSLDYLDDRAMAIKAWTENEQRREHTPIERARAIQKFTTAFGWSQAEVADQLHLSRPVISNSLRLLDLPDDIQDAMQSSQLTERQGVALLSLFSLPQKLRDAAEKGWQAAARPNEIVRQALAGASSDFLRARVDELIDLYARVITWPVNHEFYEHGPRSIRCSDCDQHISKGRQVCLESGCFELKNDLWQKLQRQNTAGAVGAQGLRPGSETSNPPAPAKPFQAVEDALKASRPPAPSEPETDNDSAPESADSENSSSPSANPPAPTPAAAPLTWEQSTIAVTVTWLPADGNPAGRQVMLAIRANQGIPSMRLCRDNEIDLTGPVGEMLLDLKSKF